MQVLVVEDNIADIRLISEAIRESTIIKACNYVKDGLEAIQYLTQVDGFSDAKTPDLILLDLNLPGKSGFEVLSELRNNEKLANIPVVIFTSSNNEEHVKRCYDLYANCYIVKPTEFVDYENVVKAVESFWGGIAALPSQN